ncbi:hypothetical protein [uncultured Desulfovibrio sp.]|uniref:hypothetical protein n=1 Tax=uncultured Desulfovibrio sp. TaxID=167968 RepID=UPI002638684D|nr:hypothetical protein [uncultured Desulfovibrio sp.]
MFPFMLFMFFCFLGVLVMLYHMLRTQEKSFRLLQEEHAQMRVLLRAMESRLDVLDEDAEAAGVRDGAAKAATRLAPRPAARPADDDLLRLSFDAPGPQGDAPAAVDPALDLHFDPAADTALQGTGAR